MHGCMCTWFGHSIIWTQKVKIEDFRSCVVFTEVVYSIVNILFVDDDGLDLKHRTRLQMIVSMFQKI